MITLGSLFDGIGGFPLSGLRNGMTTLWASEIEPFCIRVTKIRFPDMKHYGDITKINGAELEPVDIITGGSPCQDLSVAGKRAGLAGERSGLFMEMVRVIEEMLIATNREYPKAIVWENVPGAFSSNKGEDIKCVLDEFERLGFIVDMNVLDAQYMGVPQRRRRIYAACLNADHIQKMMTNTSWSIITQLLTEILLCILNGQLNLYEKEPKDSVWRQRKLTEDGLRRKMKLFRIAERKAFEKLLNNWIETSQTLLKEQYSLDAHSSKESDITTKADMTKNELLMRTENEKLFGDMLRLWKQLLEDIYSRGNLCITSTATKEITNQIIYGCANLLENIAKLIGQLKNCYPHLYETALYISIGRKECINYAKERQTSGPLFEGLEWFYHWNNYIDKYSESEQQPERYIRTESAPEVLFKREGLRRHIEKGGEAREGITADVERSFRETITVDFGNTSSRIRINPRVSVTLQAGQGGLGAMTGLYCIQGNCIDRADTAGCNGKGWTEDVCYTLNTIDRPASSKWAKGTGGPAGDEHYNLVTQKRFGEYEQGCGTLTANTGRAKTGETLVNNCYTVRRLTPLECERLQDFPDGWTDISGTSEVSSEELEFWRAVWYHWDKLRAKNQDKVRPRRDNALLKWLKNPTSDSAQYKALGNSVAVCCPEYVLEGIKEVIERGQIS